MTNSNRVLKNKENEGVNPIVAAITGAIIGATVGVIGALALKNEKNRGKVREILTNIKNQTVGYMEGMKKEVQGKKSEIKEKIIKGVKLKNKDRANKK